MGDHPLERRPWIFKISQDKPWAWPEVIFLSNPIEMQTHFSQEENRHAMYYGEEVSEETKETSHGDDKFDGGDNKFEEARAEEIAFDRAHVE